MTQQQPETPGWRKGLVRTREASAWKEPSVLAVHCSLSSGLGSTLGGQDKNSGW